MKIGTHHPHVWHRLPNGHLVPPFALYGTGRMFIATDEGLLVITCPEETPEFRPERGDVIADLYNTDVRTH